MKIKAKLIKYILSFTDYDKIKSENEKFKSDICTLIERPNSSDAYIIIRSHEMNNSISKMMWVGDCGVNSNKMTGIYNHMIGGEL